MEGCFWLLVKVELEEFSTATILLTLSTFSSRQNKLVDSLETERLDASFTGNKIKQPSLLQ